MGKFSQFCSKGFTASSIHVLCVNFVKFGEPKIGKLVCCLPDKKNKYFPRSFALASALIVSKICQGQRQTMYSECPKFHPNRSFPAEL